MSSYSQLGIEHPGSVARLTATDIDNPYELSTCETGVVAIKPEARRDASTNLTATARKQYGKRGEK
jgi:hypothetical protein